MSVRPGDKVSGRSLLCARQTTSRPTPRLAQLRCIEVDYHTLREDRCS